MTQELSTPPAPWGEHAVAEEAPTTVTIGPRTLWLREQAGELWLAHAEVDGTDPAAQPDRESWTRWALPRWEGAVRLVPAFPDRPLLVEPELSFKLLQGASARIYVRAPLWIRVELAGSEGGVVTEIPTLTLSDTWFGSFTDGELCYWLPTQARRSADPGIFEPYLAICPLQLENRSQDDLDVAKIALRVGHLSIFQDEGRLWADETRVRYRGDEEGSDIDMRRRAPDEAPDATRVAPPRTPVSRGLRTRTFARLKALSGLGAGG